MMKNFKLFFLLIAVFPKLAFTQIYDDIGCPAKYPTFCLEVFSDKLIYSSSDTICNVKINKIGAWNDSLWTSFGNGITPTSFGYPALAFTEFKGNLIAGGGFQFANYKNVNKIAYWDGIDWYPMGTGLNAQFPGEHINSLVVYNGELYAAGKIVEMNGIKGVHNIARWDGTTWRRVGTGLQGSLNEVYSMAVYKNELYVGGGFSDAGGVTAYNIAKWNGTNWSTVGLGTSSDVNVLKVDTLRNLLYVGGDFEGVNNSIYSRKVAMWDGTNWHSMSPNKFFGSTVVSMEMYHGYLYAGGYKFTDTCFARWDGLNWEVIDGPNGNVTSLQTYKDKLYLGGDFTMIGSDSIQYLASYYSPDSVFIGVEQHRLNSKIKLYPNPTKNTLKIESKLQLDLYEIYSILGSRIQSGKLINQEINVSELKTGMYILKITTNDGFLVQERFVKE
jgi:hypothetical protein